MSDKNKKQFGVWMDSQNATIIGNDPMNESGFIVIDHIKNLDSNHNSNEKTSHNHEVSLTQKFFKEIASKMPNISEIHITGTGQIQEQFMKFLAETAQYKNAHSSESTSNKMSDENLCQFIMKHYN